MGTREGSRSEDFGRLADAVRGRSDPLRTTTLSRIALNLQKLALRKETESREVQEDLRQLIVLCTPAAQRYDIERRASAPPKRRPPPLPRRVDTSHAPPGRASPPAPFPSARVGIAAAGGRGKSSILFFLAIALAILAISAIALTVVVPASEWASLTG